MTKAERLILRLLWGEMVESHYYDEKLRSWVVEFESGNICQVDSDDIDLIARFEEGERELRLVCVPREMIEQWKNFEAENKRLREALEAIERDDCKHASYEDSSDVVYRLQQLAQRALKGEE